MIVKTYHNGYNLTSGGEHNKEVSELTRQKISKSNKGRSVVNKGIPMSEEQRLLVSKRCKEAYLNGRINPQRKAVYQLDLDDNIIAEFGSMADADKATGINFRYISKCCNNKCETAGGYKWKFKYEQSLFSTYDKQGVTRVDILTTITD